MIPAGFLANVVVVASLAVCIYIVLSEKSGAIEWLQLNRRILGPFNALPDCVFCMLFWISAILSIPLIFFISNLFYIVTPFVAAPIAKAIYENCRAPRIK